MTRALSDRFLPYRLRRGLLAVSLPLITLLNTACSPTKTLSTITTAQGVTVQTDVAYGEDVRQKLDIYQPRIAPNVRMRSPVVLFVYGGSWQSGEKSGYAFMGKSLARAGYTTVVIDYRLAPQHRYPAFVQDTAAAIAWTYRNIGQYGGNPQQIFVMGHSAGAFNAVTAVDDARFWSTAGVPDNAILGVIGLAGPYAYDFSVDPTRIVFPPNAKPDDIMPDRFVRANPPPHLLLTGQADTVVGRMNVDRMTAALKKSGAQVETQQLTGVSHTSMIAAFAPPLQFLGGTRQAVLDYMQRRIDASMHLAIRNRSRWL